MTGILDRWRHETVTLTEDEAAALSAGALGRSATAVQLPRDPDAPSIARFVRAVMEPQSAWLGLVNASPVAAFEIRRPQPDRLRLVYSAPTQRLSRKIRLHLAEDLPGASFEDATTGLPVAEGDTVGGGFLTTGYPDWYPLRTGLDRPALNNVAAALHRHAMRDTRVVVQVLFQPVAGRPVRRWWWRRRGVQRRNYLSKEKQRLWGSLSPTAREKAQARAVDRKIGNARFHTSIRLLVVGAGEHTRSRVKELSGAFNVLENPDTGQYLDAVTVSSIRRSKLHQFAAAVAGQRFVNRWLSFQSSADELGALLALPDRTDQDNIPTSQA